MGWYCKCKWCGRTYERIYTNQDERLEFCGEKCYREYKEAHSGRNRAAEAASAAKAAAEKERQRTLAEVDARLEADRIAREEERKRDPKNWYGDEWAEHLVEHPEDAFQCDWSKLRGGDIVQVMLAHSQIIPKDLDWAPRLSGADWAQLLAIYPEHAGLCDWGRLDGDDWCRLLKRSPKFSEHCSWSKLNGENWAGLLVKRPEFAEHCSWGKLDTKDNRLVLEAHPEFAEKCNLKAISGASWSRLLQVQPQLANLCDKWDDIDADHWLKLLLKKPQFADKCDFSAFGRSEWLSLLSGQPKLADKCDFSVFNYWDWDQLIGVQKVFAKKFDKWSDDPIADIENICDHSYNNLAEIFDWNRLDEYAQSHHYLNSSLQGIVNRLSLSAWLRWRNSNFCSHYHDLRRDWSKFPGDLATANEDDIVAMLGFFDGFRYWPVVKPNRLSSFARAKIINEAMGQTDCEIEAPPLLEYLKTDDFTVGEWYEAWPSYSRQQLLKCLPKKKWTNEMWLALALKNIEDGHGIWHEVDDHGDESVFSPWDWGCLYGSIRGGNRWRKRWDEALKSIDERFDCSQYGAEEWASFLIGFGARKFMGSSDELMGDLSGSIAKRFLQEAVKFNFDNVSDVTKVMLSLSRVNLLEVLHVSPPKLNYIDENSDEWCDAFAWDEVPSFSAHQKFYFIARYPKAAEGLEIIGRGKNGRINEYLLRKRYPVVEIDGEIESNLNAYDFSVLSDDEWRNVLNVYPKWKEWESKRNEYKGRDPESDENHKKHELEKKKTAKNGGLFGMIKVVFGLGIVGVGLCVCLSYATGSSKSEKVHPVVEKLSTTGIKIRDAASGLVSRASKDAAASTDAEAPVEENAKSSATANSEPDAKKLPITESQIKYGSLFAVIVALLIAFRKSGIAEGGFMSFVGRTAVLGWCLYKAGEMAITAQLYSTSAIMLSVVGWVLFNVCRGRSRSGWWRWLIMAGCFGAGLSGLQSAAIAGAVVLVLGPAKIK